MSPKNIDYRKYFKEYYGINFSSKYDIHHIDLNHNNNSIKNLMILPKDLHHKYHFYLESMSCGGKRTERVIDLSMTSEYCSKEAFSTLMLKKLLDILPECSKWHDYKLYLDGIIDNVHEIELEE